MLRIGSYNIGSQTILAPMAGVSDLPYRSICSKLGAGLVVNEMLTSDTRLWTTQKSLTRLSWGEIVGPRTIQIAGSEPQQMADAASACVDLGAQIVDINMGCPAKKVCNKAAGSALLKDEHLVEQILNSVVKAVTVPVTLKIRTGWDPQNKNAQTIAQIAQDSGIAALTIHGRTRACRFNGSAEYDTIAKVVQQLNIPVIANGDIDSPEKAKYILDYTKANAVMIGRAAQGNPWLFREINHYLVTGRHLSAPTLPEIEETIVNHLSALHEFYGEYLGARIARKHLSWYLEKQFYAVQEESEGCQTSEEDQVSDANERTHNSCAASRHGDDNLSATQSKNENEVFKFALTYADAKIWREHFNIQITKQKQLNAVRNLFDRLQLLKDQAA